MKGQNYGVQISLSFLSKIYKEIRFYLLVSLIGSISITLLVIHFKFEGGLQFYFELMFKEIYFYFKTTYAERFASEYDFSSFYVVNRYWESYKDKNNLFINTFICSFVIFLVSSYFLSRRVGKSFQKDKLERNDELHFVSENELKNEIIEEVKRENNDLQFTNEDVYLGKNEQRVPFGIASMHFGFVGASKTGKSNAINELLIQDRKIGSKCLIVDPRGQFYAKHGKPGDHILSLNDIRQKKWDFWHEDLPFKFLADALVEVKESSSQSKFFDKSGREVLAAVLKHTSSLEELWQVVNYDEESLYNFLVDHKELSKQLLGKKASGQSAGIIATSILNMSFIKSMNHHAYEREKIAGKEEDFFSLTKWVENDEDDSWIFIIDDIRNLAEAQPLHRLWFDIVTSSAYDRDLKKSLLKQINLYCDEITTVGNLPTLPSVLDKGRNFRLRLIIGFQSYHQLELIYGKDMARNIFQGLQNVIIFASNDESEARIFSERMGRSTIIETDQSLSLQDKHNHTSLSQKTRQIECVTSSQIQALKDNICFLKLARFNPTKIEFMFHKMPDVNVGSRSIVPNTTILDDIELKEYESKEKKEENKVQDKKNEHKAKTQDVNSFIKNILDEAIDLFTNGKCDSESTDKLALKILERFGATQGLKVKIDDVPYAISIYKPKKTIYLTAGEFECAIPFPMPVFKNTTLIVSEDKIFLSKETLVSVENSKVEDSEELSSDEQPHKQSNFDEKLKFVNEDDSNSELKMKFDKKKFQSIPIKFKQAEEIGEK